MGLESVRMEAAWVDRAALFWARVDLGIVAVMLMMNVNVVDEGGSR